MYIMAPEPVSTAYIINLSHQSVCLYVYSLPLLGNESLNTSLTLLENDSIKMLPFQRIQMQQ
jgi:hypothetical protein